MTNPIFRSKFCPEDQNAASMIAKSCPRKEKLALNKAERRPKIANLI